jgi:hypothetical protein
MKMYTSRKTPQAWEMPKTRPSGRRARSCSRRHSGTGQCRLGRERADVAPGQSGGSRQYGEMPAIEGWSGTQPALPSLTDWRWIASLVGVRVGAVKTHVWTSPLSGEHRPGLAASASLGRSRLSIIFDTTFRCARCKSPCSRPRLSDRLTAPICSYVPSAILRPDKTICVGGSGIAKNIGVVDRINSNQAAGYHKSTAIPAVAVFGRNPRRGAENAQCGSEGKRDERSASNHGDLPFVCRGGVVPRLKPNIGLEPYRHFSGKIHF